VIPKSNLEDENLTITTMIMIMTISPISSPVHIASAAAASASAEERQRIAQKEAQELDARDALQLSSTFTFEF
jgi:hypothetical protein